MAKNKKKTKYRYVTRVKKRWRKMDKRIPLLTTIPVLNSAVLQPILGDSGRIGAKKMMDSGASMFDAALEAANIMSMNFTGFSIKGSDAGKFTADYLVPTYIGIIAGGIGSKLATKFGVNRNMKKIPLLGKYVKL